MPGIKHATKKRFAKSTTTKRSIQSGISAEFTEFRSKLERVVTAVKSLIKQIQATANVWGSVAKHQTAFASALLAALPAEGLVRSHARETEGIVRNLQRELVEQDAAASPHRRIMAVLESYLKLVQNVQAEYPPVETSYTEVVRYQKKVDKLLKKGQKKATILQRNHEKLSAARAEYDRKIAAILERMKPTYDKHEAVFQCAHHAFWLAQEKYSAIINDTTKSIRWESMAMRDHVLNVDVNSPAQLPPIPRAQMLMPPETVAEMSSIPIVEYPPSARQSQTVAVVPQQPSPQKLREFGAVQYIPSPASATTIAEALPVYESTTAAARQQVVHLTPDNPAVKVALPPRSEQSATAKKISSAAEVVYIPAPPTERPPAPVPRQRSTGAEPAVVGA